MNDQETYDSVKWALEAGYKHIDTAEWYENEKQTGRALNDWLSEWSAVSPDHLSSLRPSSYLLEEALG